MIKGGSEMATIDGWKCRQCGDECAEADVKFGWSSVFEGGFYRDPEDPGGSVWHKGCEDGEHDNGRWVAYGWCDDIEMEVQ